MRMKSKTAYSVKEFSVPKRFIKKMRSKSIEFVFQN